MTTVSIAIGQASGIRVLFICTANQCRSPMAKAFFRARLVERGADAEVASAGFMTAGVEPPFEVIDVMEERGISLEGHRSRTVSPELIARADLVATMTRQQLIEIVTLAGDAWTRCFTLTDLVRRAEAVGPLPGDLALRAWVHRVHGNRPRSSLLSLDLGDDIDDPMGERRSAYSRTAHQIDDLVGRLAALLVPSGARPPV